MSRNTSIQRIVIKGYSDLGMEVSIAEEAVSSTQNTFLAMVSDTKPRLFRTLTDFTFSVITPHLCAPRLNIS